MSVAGVPNSIYVWQSALADLSGISRAAGYYTNVEIVKGIDFFPQSSVEIAKLVSMAVDGYSLFGWVTGESFAEQQLGGADVWCTDATFAGFLKRPESALSGIRFLAADLIRVMRNNVRRTYPGSDPSLNAYGMSTQAVGPITYDYADLDGGVSMAGFLSSWRFTYKFPAATG